MVRPERSPPVQSKLSDRSVAVVLVVYTAVTVWNVGILLQSSGVATF